MLCKDNSVLTYFNRDSKFRFKNLTKKDVFFMNVNTKKGDTITNGDIVTSVNTEKDKSTVNKSNTLTKKNKARAQNFMQDNYMMTMSTQRDYDEELKISPKFDLNSIKEKTNINEIQNKPDKLKQNTLEFDCSNHSENVLKLENKENHPANTTIEYTNQINDVKFEELNFSISSYEESNKKDYERSYELNDSRAGENIYEVAFTNRRTEGNEEIQVDPLISTFIFK